MRKKQPGSNAGRPGKKKSGGGNPSYAGYDYQIEVTIWVALDLMLAKGATDTLVIEPPSHEDIEASVHDPSKAQLGIAGTTEQFDFVLQAKSRSTGPWSAKALSDVLLGKLAKTKSRGGPPPRARPLAMLAQDPRKRYVFVTNESLGPSLHPYRSNALLEWSSEAKQLPPHTRTGFNATGQESIAPRIALCSIVTNEVLRGRIEKLLTYHGHVPIQKHEVCIKHLRDEVRGRISGEHQGQWQKASLIQALRHHGGAISSVGGFHHYVRPRSFAAIEQALLERHAVVITGPSGTGKTLTADFLEQQLRQSAPPFLVVGEKDGPNGVRDYLNSPDPVLFHLRDPWGSNRLEPGADRWNNELPKLLGQADPTHKFLVTTRTDILHSAGARNLRPYSVPIEIEDYGEALMADIYDRMCQDLPQNLRGYARLHRDRVLRDLHRPFEIDRFIAALGSEDPRKPRAISVLIAESQIEAISSVVRNQVIAWGEGGMSCAALVRALLASRDAVSADVVLKLRRVATRLDPSFRPEIDAFVDFLIAGRNLRRDGQTLALYHPRVEEGLRMALLERKAESESVLSLICDALVAWDADSNDWGVETVLQIRRAMAKLEGVQMSLAPATSAALDCFLLAASLTDEDKRGFNRRFLELAKFSSDEFVPSRLARCLVDGGTQPKNSFIIGERWVPPQLRDADWQRLSSDPSTATLASLFIRRYLPASGTEYPEDLHSTLRTLTESVDEDFRYALRAALDIQGVIQNIDAIVVGVCSAREPDFDWVIEQIAAATEKVNQWFEGFAEEQRSAEEHEVDAGYADHLVDEPGERYYTVNEAMKIVAGLRYAREGLDWFLSHPRRDMLADALSDLFRSARHRIDPAALRLLLSCCKDWSEVRAWDAIHKHWDASLADVLEQKLSLQGMDNEHLRQTLVKIVLDTATAGATAHDALVDMSRKCRPTRRLELVFDVANTMLDSEISPRSVRPAPAIGRAHALADTYEGNERKLARALVDAVNQMRFPDIAASLSADAVAELERLLEDLPISIAGIGACLAMSRGVDARPTVARLLATGESDDGQLAVRALAIKGDAEAYAAMRKALSHHRYQVRQEAFFHLARAVTVEDRPMLLACAKDRSADVRLAFADQMRELKWMEAVDDLVALLADRRNFNERPDYIAGPTWPQYRVARAAAEALRAYDDLPEYAVSALLERAADDECKDIFVLCEALKAIAERDNVRVTPTLVSALQAPGIDGHFEYRPKAQAAAWGLVFRAHAGKLNLTAEQQSVVVDAALEQPPHIAGPVLIACASREDSTRRRLLRELKARDLADRRTLLLTASAFTGHLPENGVEPFFRKLAAAAAQRDDALKAAFEDAELCAWSRALDPKVDVQGTTAWIVWRFLRVKEESFDPQRYILPKRVGILTMRSMSPDRELRCTG